MSAWGDETEFFFGLTPEIILDCVEKAGIPTTGRCLQRNSMENRVYEVELDVDSRLAQDRFRIVKFYRPGRWSEEQILEEHSFLLELHENEVPCTIPLPFAEGETLDEAQGIYFALFPRQGGRQLDELSREQELQLGRLLARVHNVGSARPAEHRIRLDETVYGIENLEWILEHASIPKNIALRYEAAARNVIDGYKSIRSTLEGPDSWPGPLASIRLHGDCHSGNVLWNDQGPFLIDFDDMVTGPPVQDLWLLAADSVSLDRILEGYEEMRDFDRRSLALIEGLRALRYIHFSAWIARRYEDPAFPAAFPQFGSERYWSEQTADLYEQLEAMRPDESGNE